VEGDFSITYRIEPSNVAMVFQKYRMGIDEINRGPLRNMLGDALNEVSSTLSVTSVYGEGKNEMMAEVQDLVISKALKSGVTVTGVSILGAFRLPEQVMAALNSKIEATQRAEQRENELREAEAEAKKKVAVSKGEAEANRARISSLTENLIEYERLQNERLAIEKWNGQLPTTMLPGSSLPFVNLK